MSDYFPIPDFDNLVTAGSSHAFLWNNVSSQPLVQRDSRYKIAGGRITGENSHKLQREIEKAVAQEDLVLVIAGGNDLFDADTHHIRLREDKINQKGLLVQTYILEEIKTFYRNIIKIAVEEDTTVIILSIFPRYFECKNNKEYYFPQEKLLRKANSKLRQFVESRGRENFRETKKWMKVRFIDLTTHFLENIEKFYKDPIDNVHLSKQGKIDLVRKLKFMIVELYRNNFEYRGEKISRMLTTIEEEEKEKEVK